MSAAHPERVTNSSLDRVEATCLACSWSSDACNGHGNAARHHDATGHAVRVVVTRITTYGTPDAQLPGQENLMDQIGATA